MLPVKKRILGLDIGDKRIGIAVSDPAGRTAFGLQTLERSAFKKDAAALLKIAEEYEAETIIVGLPLDLNEREGRQAEKIRFFTEGFEKILRECGNNTILKLWEESFSSREAEELLLKADMGRKKRRIVIDKIAAALILQSYLDSL